ncbi:hypothetical protein KY345_03555 [Candidatus Woesearchaeota archaeon]|nr:hypothetical protein [Candidatus Woesearchaeota archaeon]
MKKEMIDLDECVVSALELFAEKGLPEIEVGEFKRPLVVGSGNAAATGRIIFENTDAVFADESNFELKLKTVREIDGVVLVSASGGKHAPVIAKKAKSMGKKVILLTNNENALAKEFSDETHVFPKNTEPYTYNTSTYMGMILTATKEGPRNILNFIKEKIDKLDMPDFATYRGYFLIIPEEFEEIKRMLQVKFIELFGRRLARDVETFEYMKHAVTVVPSNELFISFGKENRDFGEERFFVPLPRDADYGAMMAIAYYIIGKIQKSYPPWFKQNIEEYCKKASKIFGQEIKPIVE